MHRSLSFLKPRISKGVFLGQASVGKTALIERIINDSFIQKASSTIGIDLMTADLSYQNLHFKLQLWDTAGQEKYQCMIPTYIKGSVCALFVFDLSNLQSLVNIQKWINLFRLHNDKINIIQLLCGNKSDLAQDGRMSKELQRIISKNRLQYFQISAKTGKGVPAMMQYISKRLYQIHPTPTKQQKPKRKTYTNKSDDYMQSTSRTLNSIKINEIVEDPKRKFFYCNC